MRVVSKTRNMELSHKPFESYMDIIKRNFGMGEKRDLQLTNVNMLVNGFSQDIQKINEKYHLQEFLTMSKID